VMYRHSRSSAWRSSAPEYMAARRLRPCMSAHREGGLPLAHPCR
jgi:hypothetical protein